MTTQTLDRAIALLRLLAASPEGTRLVDLQAATGLTKPTVHRILDTLCHHDLAARDPASRRYALGPEISLLAASVATSRIDLVELAREHMLEVAHRTGDTSFLMARSGFDTVCLDRQTGSYPVKAFTVDVGSRRPLGLGAGGIILLGTLDDTMREAAYQRVHEYLKPLHRVTVAQVRAAVEQAQRKGYALSNGFVVESVGGVAVPIMGPDGKVVASMSVAAIKERVGPRRLPQVLSILQSHAKSIEQRLAERIKKKSSTY
ncbi:IclR family transcriptional regulator [Ottowia thiooxydans]|uniref:IclR family transcriptional regulator n=1 Tax=Ottowia thiooxydans TaxID=219182 RepID=UPI000400CA3F|nr:IclR family transcriptional regulator [Ottowia thiooxydans]